MYCACVLFRQFANIPVSVNVQKSFHEDVVRVIRKRLEVEETLPEDQKQTALARSYYLKVRFSPYSV